MSAVIFKCHQIAQSIKAILATADFRAPLRTSLVPTRGTGAPTFTRATTATVVDHEGVLRTCLAGEARFTGARRVRNLIPVASEDLTNAAWSKRDTTYSGGRLIETATTSDHSILQAVTSAVGDVIAVSCYAKADQNSFLQILFSTGQVSGNPKANFNVSTGVLGTVDSGIAASITPAPDVGVGYYRCTAVVTMAAASCTPFFGMVQAANSARLQSYAGNVSNGIYLTKIQVENITGRTDQTTPSEYVSVGATDLVGAELVTNGGFDSAASWTLGAGTSIGSGVLSFNGTNNATADQASVMVIGKSYIGTFTVASGSGNVTFYFGAFGGIAIPGVTAGNTYTVRGVCAGDTKLYLQSEGTTFTGSLDNVSVKENLFHGTGVDGVKCYDTTLAGVPIPTATLKGYLAEGARANLLLRSQDFNSANWNLAGGNFTVTDSGIASPIAGVNFQKLAVTTTANTNCSQTVAGSGSTSGNTYSVYVKKGSGATECNRFNFYNNTTAQDLYRGTLDYDTGVFTTTGGTGTAVVQTLPNGVYRLQLTNTAGVSNGDNLIVYCGFVGGVVTAGKYLYAIGAQLEAGPTATSYTPTTATAVTRNADVLTYPSTGNVLGTVGTCYTEVTFPNGASSTQPPRIITANSAAERNLLYVSGTLGGKGRLSNYDGTSVATEVGYTVDIGGALNKVAGSWRGSASTVAIGGLSNSGTFDGDFNVNELRIGNLFAAGYELNGNIANVCIWTRKLPDAILKRISK